MKNRKYIYTNKKHSQKAIMSVILGIISLGSVLLVVYLTSRAGGEAANGYGVTGLLATLFSFEGLILGILTVRENVYYRFLPILGTILNLLCLVCISMILYLGNIL
jgi:hypothetical protein